MWDRLHPSFIVSRHRIVTSSSNHQRLEAASEYLETLLGDSEVLVLAPTRGAADDFVRGCSGRLGNFSGVHRLTPIQLAASLATERLARSNLAPISRLGIEALAARSVYKCHSELRYFGPVASTPGFSRALASTLRELRMEAVKPERLRATGAPGNDLARLLACYETELEARSLADLACLYEFATDCVASGSRHRLLGLPVLLLDVSAELARERAFLAALTEKCPAILATALAPRTPAEEDTSGVKTLEKILATQAESLSNGPGGGGETAPPPKGQERRQGAVAEDFAGRSLDRLRRYVFLTDAPPLQQLDSSVEFFSAPGEGLECVEIARRIRAAAEAGVAFDRMAILLRHPDAYLPLVEDALRRAGVPGYFTAGTIRPDPSGRAFLALLDCAADGLSASKFAEYLSLGQVPIVDESGAPPGPVGIWVAPEDETQLSFRFPGSAGVPPASHSSAFAAAGEGTLGNSAPLQGSPGGIEVAQLSAGETPALPETDESPVIEGTLRAPFGWEQLLIDAAVIGGKDRWSRRLRGLKAEFNFRLQRLTGEDEPRREHLERQLERLNHLESFALPVIEFLGSLPKSARWGDWLRALRDLAEMALRQPESVLSVLSELEPMDEVGPVELGEVRQVLSERLRVLRREPPTRRYGRVFVGSIDEVRARSFEIVFLTGLAEGVFPRKPSEDPLLLDEARQKLDSGLTLQEQRLTRERLLLRSAAATARSRLCVSYPRMDTVLGRARVPSFYALEVLRAAEGRLPALGELEKRATEAAGSRLGWPAPRDPQDAIDDVEHDLALLEQIIHQPGKDVKGHARYLLGVNENLARSLRTRAARWKKSWSGADGIVDPDESTLRVLASQRITARSYSPTALQHFAACPYRFLLYAIHRLEEREAAVAIEKLDPLTRGGLFHEVQFEVFGDLRQAGLLPVTEENLSRAMGVVDHALRKSWRPPYRRSGRARSKTSAPTCAAGPASSFRSIGSGCRSTPNTLSDSSWAPSEIRKAARAKP
ncbi:MAG: PD-(D/E)XK nuclease family protein [Acidobacteria bacterium]|nr:MAG: PD-(D/E)XK nuclease family protein [Acidobacteriota bacterium]